jgi:hypothetical protein
MLLFEPPPIGAQSVAGIGPDSVETVAARGFAAGGFHRSLFGNNYRDLWTLPIRVPILHITQFDGGIRPYKVGGGKQTIALRLLAADSAEYTFRPVYKLPNLPEDFKGTVAWKLMQDAGSASHPAANLAPVPLMDHFGFLHPQPILVFMPDDPALGEFRKQFAGVLGTIEKYPTAPKAGRAFAGATDVLEAEDLLEAINKDPSTRVDARTLLRIRTVDLLLGDNDRHADQWRWAKLPGSELYRPIARDRDKVFLSYGGMVLKIARMVYPRLVTFDSVYANPTSLFLNATEFDRRLLGSLDRSVWESTAKEVQAAVTNEMIDRAVAGFPAEYSARSADIVGKLRARRDNLPAEVLDYYTKLFYVADVHATDAPDVAAITRQADGSVDVSLQSGESAPWFQRRYDPAETREIRVYLHDGDDRATITGNAQSSIQLRVIGGNGTNAIIDQSVVGGQGSVARIYDEGTVEGVKYGKDEELEKWSYVDALNSYHNRRPFVHAYGGLIPPQKDYGAKIKPVVGMKTGHGLGLVPKVGLARYVYGFRKVPYASMIQADVGYSTGSGGWVANLLGDKRFTSSSFHVGALGRMSQIEVIQFRGFGNDVEEDDDPFFDVKQTQWSFRPTIGFSFARESDITFGPIVRYTKTDSTVNNFLAFSEPYGFSTFKQAGLQLAMHYESRVVADTSKARAVVDFAGNAYPGFWDANSAYQSVEGDAALFITIPVLTKPVIAVRGGGKKLYGDFPYFDAAFLGGGSSFRTEHRQRYAGDASVYGSAELRIPIVRFPTILPTEIGAIGFTDAGRVYVDGESPGGWHTAAGGGMWIALWKSGYNVNVLYTNRSNRRVIVNLGFEY